MIRNWSVPGVMLLFIALSWFGTSHALAFDASLDEAPACDPIESHCEVR